MQTRYIFEERKLFVIIQNLSNMITRKRIIVDIKVKWICTYKYMIKKCILILYSLMRLQYSSHLILWGRFHNDLRVVYMRISERFSLLIESDLNDS